MKIKIKILFGFGFFCLISGCTWMLRARFPPAFADLWQLSLHDGVLGLLFLVPAMVFRSGAGLRVYLACAGWSAVLFAGPPLVGGLVGGRVSSLSQVIVFALVPAFTVFLQSQMDEGSEGMQQMLPAVFAVGALTLAVDFTLPSSPSGFVALAVLGVFCSVLSYAAIRLYRLLHQISLVESIFLACAASSLVACVSAILAHEVITWNTQALLQETLWAIVVDLPLTVLAMWLLRRMSPVGFSSRFMLIPLITIVGGIAATRPTVGVTAWAGLVLAAGASVALLSHQEPEQAS